MRVPLLFLTVFEWREWPSNGYSFPSLFPHSFGPLAKRDTCELREPFQWRFCRKNRRSFMWGVQLRIRENGKWSRSTKNVKHHWLKICQFEMESSHASMLHQLEYSDSRWLRDEYSDYSGMSEEGMKIGLTSLLIQEKKKKEQETAQALKDSFPTWRERRDWRKWRERRIGEEGDRRENVESYE